MYPKIQSLEKNYHKHINTNSLDPESLTQKAHFRNLAPNWKLAEFATQQALFDLKILDSDSRSLNSVSSLDRRPL